MSIEHFLFSKGTKFPQSCHLVTLSHPETDYEVKPANFLGPKDGHCTFVVSGMTLLTPGSSLGRDISPAPSKPQHGTWLSIHTHWPRDLPTQYPVSPYEVGLTPPGLPDLWAQHDPVATPPVSLSQSWCHPLPFFLPLSQLPLMPRKGPHGHWRHSQGSLGSVLAPDRRLALDSINLNALFIHSRINSHPSEPLRVSVTAADQSLSRGWESGGQPGCLSAGSACTWCCQSPI